MLSVIKTDLLRMKHAGLHAEREKAVFSRPAMIYSLGLPVLLVLASVGALIITLTPAQAATTSNLNFQGRLASNTGGLVADGSYNVEFKIYDDSLAGTNYWTENRTGGNAVKVKNGYFSVYLGDVTPFGTSIPWNQNLWMTMNVNGDGEMTPRFKLSAVPYAFQAGAITDSVGNSYTGDDLIQKAPSAIQAVNSALAAIRFNQSGAGSLLQLQGDGADVFMVAKNGGATLGAGITVGNSTDTTAGTIRWSGSDLEVYNGSAWVSLTSGSGGGGGTLTADSFYAYDATGNTNIAGGWTDLTLDTEVKEDLPYTHAVDAADVTINEDGWYEISYNVSAYTSTGGNSQVSMASKLQENIGGGFTDIPGSFGYSAVTTGPADGSVAVTVLRQFVTGDIIKIQAQRATGTITMLTRANSTGLTIKKFVDAGAGGGSATSFEQNGNNFGGTAILGTTSNDGLTIITNNNPALTFTSVGNATFANTLSVSGGLNLAGDISSSTGLTLSSGGGNDLQLNSSSGTILLSANNLKRAASGTTAIDLFDNGAGTTLSLINSSGSQVAGLSVEGSVSASAFNGSGSGLTGLNGSNISSGTVADGRLSSNVVLLDQNQTFTGTPTFNSGLVLSNSASSTAGAVRWSGTDFEGYDGIQWVSLTVGAGAGGGGGGSSSPATTSVTKTANKTIVSSTVLQNDNHLFFSIGASETWNYRFVIQATTPAAAGIKFAITAPAGAVCQVSFVDESTASSQSGVGCGTASTTLTGTGTNKVYEVSGSVTNGTNAGQITLQWAQGTSNAGNTTVLRGSFVSASVDGGGMVFLQGGNNFGATAVLGTKGANNLNFIVNNSTGLSLTTGNQALFSGEIMANGGLTIGDNASDGLTIVSNSVALTNGLNFDSNTLVIDSSNDRVGINNATPGNRLSLNTATTTSSTAQALFATGGTANKGLVIQGVASQSANLFELQSSSGSLLSGFNSGGGLVLGLSTFSSTATLARSVSLPDASGTVCLSSSTLCGYIQLASGLFQTDATTNNTIAINKTGASGNLLVLQKNGGAVFTVSNSGALEIQSTSANALDIRNVGGSSYFNVNTSTGVIQIGSSTADANGILFVLDAKTGTDPTGTNGGIYYNSTLAKFRCFEAGVWKDCVGTKQIRSFVDTAADAVTTNNTTNYWDLGAENNNATPNITPSATTKTIYGSVSVQISSTTTQDRSVVTRVERGIGSAPTCGSGTVVGFYASTFTTNSGEIVTATVNFLDSPSTTSQVFYTVCSDSNTTSAAGVQIDKIRLTLEEANNSN